MARIRTIKPQFWESERVGRMSILARLTFLGLISLADDEGRGRGSPQYLMSALHAYDIAGEVTEKKFLAALSEIEQAGVVNFYTVRGCAYYALPGWLEHQRVDHPQKSSIPEQGLEQGHEHGKSVGKITQTIVNTGSFANIREDSRGTPGGMEGKGREWNGTEETELAPSRETGSAPILDFPCVGAVKIWSLKQDDITTWTADYPGLDVLGEARKAHAWLCANPSRRKTPRGMPRFLVGWLSRVSDRRASGGQRVQSASPLPLGDDPRRKLLRAYRAALGLPAADETAEIARYPSAKDEIEQLLAVFGQDDRRASEWLISLGDEMRQKGLSWSLKTAIRRALDSGATQGVER